MPSFKPKYFNWNENQPLHNFCLAVFHCVTAILLIFNCLMSSGIDSLFNKINCDRSAIDDMLGAATGVTDNNMIQYLGIIEQRTNELLAIQTYCNSKVPTDFGFLWPHLSWLLLFSLNLALRPYLCLWWAVGMTLKLQNSQNKVLFEFFKSTENINENFL